MGWLPDKKEKKEAPVPEGNGPAEYQAPKPNGGRDKHLHEIKRRLHRTLVERLDIAQLETMEDAQVASEIRRAVAQLLADDPFPLTHEERARLAQELEFEILGLGPLEPLVRDNTISDILVNRFDEVFIERFGHLELTDVKFRDNAHLMKIINKIVSNIGRRIDESSPMVDARLPDGSRVNAVILPLMTMGIFGAVMGFILKRLIALHNLLMTQGVKQSAKELNGTAFIPVIQNASSLSVYLYVKPWKKSARRVLRCATKYLMRMGSKAATQTVARSLSAREVRHD